MRTGMCLVLITAPNKQTAKVIAVSVVKNRMAACVTIISRVQSTYWWENKIHNNNEILLLAKTKMSVLKRMIPFVKKIHPYTVPEIIAVDIKAGFKPYLNWI